MSTAQELDQDFSLSEYLDNYEDIQHGLAWSEEVKMTTAASNLANASNVGIFITVIVEG